ncbi:aminoglycoside phosphotransferase [Actinomadura decatromicini]|uniref:Aminoglycoside phosphotransferase n=1 Tax=Actinomadura decatromicini TaxID=2604572 RepID=A0A5D3F526_9ACTN|nr:aminoglycoside phosphotransferase [Actinomadura decatromicini]
MAVVLDTDNGPVFLKGLPVDHPRRWTQDMEAVINPYVRHLGPRLLWRVRDEWDILGFEYIKGRHADPTPGSADLPKVVETISHVGEIPCPSLPLKEATSRWRNYVDDSLDLALLDGDRLLHTDYNPLNILMAEGRALLVDWAWPTRGAGWIDPACLVLRIMSYGHTAEQAEAVVADLSAWRQADPRGLQVFAEANARFWAGAAADNPADWPVRMAAAAQSWHAYRLNQD